MAVLSRFSEDVLEEELNALSQKVIPEKTIKYKENKVQKISKVRKYQFDSFTRRIVAAWCITSTGCFNNCLSKKYCCSLVSSSKISTSVLSISIANRQNDEGETRVILSGDRNFELVV